MKAGARRYPGGFPLVLEPVQARAIARCAKTQLRRTTSTSRLDDGTVVPRGCGLKSSSTYEVLEGANGEPVARIVVTGVGLQQLGDMSPGDALAEGHESLPAFADWWLRRHDRSWPPQEEKLCSNCQGHAEYSNHEGIVVPCEVCEIGVVMGDAPQMPAEILDRFARHADRQVWVVSFMLDDRLFMHRLSQRGYTSDPSEAMPDEPEVVPPAEVERMAKAGRRRHVERQVADIEVAGIDELRRMAHDQGIDRRDLVRAEQRRVQKAEEREAAWLARQLRGRVEVNDQEAA